MQFWGCKNALKYVCNWGSLAELKALPNPLAGLKGGGRESA